MAKFNSEQQRKSEILGHRDLAMQQIIDITIPLDANTKLYPGDEPVKLSRVSDIGNGDLVTTSQLSITCHIGTHVDLPGHFIKEGALLNNFDVARFVGPAIVLDLCGLEVITDAEIRKHFIPHNHHVLLKTDNSSHIKSPEFREDYVCIEPEAASYLVAHHPLSVGIDYYSLDSVTDSDFSSHRIMAKAGLPVFVCLDLEGVNAGFYTFAGLPIHLSDVEGAPVRAILWK